MYVHYCELGTTTVSGQSQICTLNLEINESIGFGIMIYTKFIDGKCTKKNRDRVFSTRVTTFSPSNLINTHYVISNFILDTSSSRQHIRIRRRVQLFLCHYKFGTIKILSKRTPNERDSLLWQGCEVRFDKINVTRQCSQKTQYNQKKQTTKKICL